jgi:Ca2+-binding RTX toxin-like protein
VSGRVQQQDDSQMATINGTTAPDSLDGGVAGDLINGLAGNDTLHGFSGNDTINGGVDSDLVYGGLGDDLVIVGRGDTVHGDEDDDDLRYTGSDPTGLATYVYGDAGNDKATFDFSDAVDSITSYNNSNGSGGIAGIYYYAMESLELIGGGASDSLAGGIGADTLTGGAGNDRLIGGLGANRLTGGAGRDFGGFDISDSAANHNVVFVSGALLNLGGSRLTQIEGLGLKTGAGKDKINVAAETIGSEIDTGAGNDTIIHGAAADILSGGAGADSITAGRGDTSHGNDDNDLLSGAFDDSSGAATYFYGDLGNDRLTLDFSASADPLSSYNNNNGSGGAGGVYYYDIELLVLTGGSSSDVLTGGVGNDTLTGGAGNDRLNGGLGANKIVGGAGKDLGAIDVSATGGNRTVVFDPGATLVFLGNSLSQIEGLGLKAGTGHDSIDVSAETIGSEIDGGGGNDTITGGAAYDLLNGGIGNDAVHALRGDVVHGNDGNDAIDFIFDDNGGAATYSYGDAGLDTLTADFSGASDAVSSYNNNNGSGGIGGLYYYDTETLLLTGSTASDLLVGGLGNDQLSGGTGNDRLSGGLGANTIVGGAGLDIGLVDYSTVNADQTVNFRPTQLLAVGGNRLSQIEGLGLKTGGGDDSIDVSKETIGSEIDAGGGDDGITGGVGADLLNGGTGNDTITAGAGDITHGNDGNDSISLVLPGPVGATYVYGDGDADRLTLNFGAATAAIGGYNNNNGSGGIGGVYYYDIETLALTGGAAADTLVGGTGNDTLTGGLLGDSLDGRGGNDRYRYVSTNESAASGPGRDTLLTFDNGDVIDLSTIDANTDVAGNQAFAFRGTAAFNHAGQVRYEASGADTLVLISTDADATAEMAILITGTHALAAGDFAL